MVAVQGAMLKHQADLRALYDMLVAEVAREFLGVRAELGAISDRLRGVEGLDPLRRTMEYSDEAGSQCWFQTFHKRPLPFELYLRMWEGSSRDRKLVEMSKDTTKHSAWRDRTFTVIACTYQATKNGHLMTWWRSRSPRRWGSRCRSPGSDVSPMRCVPM